jgi:hypothetical protein
MMTTGEVRRKDLGDGRRSLFTSSDLEKFSPNFRRHTRDSGPQSNSEIDPHFRTIEGKFHNNESIQRPDSSSEEDDEDNGFDQPEE